MRLEIVRFDRAHEYTGTGAEAMSGQSAGEADGQWKVSAALLAAGAIGLGAMTFFATRTPTRRRLAWGILKAAAGSSLVRSAVFSAGAALARWQLGRFFTPQAHYEVEARFGDVEVRRYPMAVVAETNVVAATSGAASNRGFDRLASYILGENRPLHPEAAGDKGEKIPMTGPVLTQRDGRSWLVRFTMPTGFTLANLPVPTERGIRLRAIPPHRVAALRYSGAFDAEKTLAMQARLLDAVREVGLESIGEPIFAGYDPPSTLPLLRRNEAWVELGRSSARSV